MRYADKLVSMRMVKISKNHFPLEEVKFQKGWSLACLIVTFPALFTTIIYIAKRILVTLAIARQMTNSTAFLSLPMNDVGADFWRHGDGLLVNLGPKVLHTCHSL